MSNWNNVKHETMSWKQCRTDLKWVNLKLNELNRGTSPLCPRELNWMAADPIRQANWTELNWCQTILNFEQEDIISSRTLPALVGSSNVAFEKCSSNVSYVLTNIEMNATKGNIALKTITCMPHTTDSNKITMVSIMDTGSRYVEVGGRGPKQRPKTTYPHFWDFGHFILEIKKHTKSKSSETVSHSVSCSS